MSDLIKKMRSKIKHERSEHAHIIGSDEHPPYVAISCDEADEMLDALEAIQQDAMCIWEDCDQQAIYCEGHANELVNPLGVNINQLRSRIAELESALRQLEMAESEAVRNHVKQALKGGNDER